MSIENVETLIVGGGQAGLAMSAHLRKHNAPHLILERDRIAERWRSARWNSLVANGPAWHDRFPDMEFSRPGPDEFATKDEVVSYLETFADQIEAPIRCGVEVLSANKLEEGAGFLVKTTEGELVAKNIVAATGPFQKPVFPAIVPETPAIKQIHSRHYREPSQLPDGGVLVVGAGSSGAQIADELLRSGRKTYLSVGPHDRPPRAYRGHDYCWWLGVLGKWEMKTPPAGSEHVTISVSGAYGGHTVDFRKFAERGMHLVGMATDCTDGQINFSNDLADNIRRGDENYLSVLREADDYIAQNNLDLPPEPMAHIIGEDPKYMRNPILQLDLEKEEVRTIVWATGYVQDFGWLNVNAFDENGNPSHSRGISTEPGVYFLGLPWLSMRGSSFIWGVWKDAEYLAAHIANR